MFGCPLSLRGLLATCQRQPLSRSPEAGAILAQASTKGRLVPPTPLSTPSDIPEGAILRPCLRRRLPPSTSRPASRWSSTTSTCPTLARLRSSSSSSPPASATRSCTSSTAPTPPFPLVLGHESTGVVVAGGQGRHQRQGRRPRHGHLGAAHTRRRPAPIAAKVTYKGADVNYGAPADGRHLHLGARHRRRRPDGRAAGQGR